MATSRNAGYHAVEALVPICAAEAGVPLRSRSLDAMVHEVEFGSQPTARPFEEDDELMVVAEHDVVRVWCDCPPRGRHGCVEALY